MPASLLEFPLPPEPQPVSLPAVTYLMRHAHAGHNLQKDYFDSNIDSRLTSLGKQQAVLAGNFLAAQAIDLVLCTPKLRGSETYQWAQHGLQDIPVLADERLAEFDWGTWAGQRKTEMLTDAEKARAARLGHHYRPNPQADTNAKAHADVANAIQDGLALPAVARVAGRLPRLLIISHSSKMQAYDAIETSKSRGEMLARKMGNGVIRFLEPGLSESIEVCTPPQTTAEIATARVRGFFCDQDRSSGQSRATAYA